MFFDKNRCPIGKYLLDIGDLFGELVITSDKQNDNTCNKPRDNH